MFALVADQNKKTDQLLAGLLSVEELAEYSLAEQLVKELDPIVRLPAIDLAAPALRTLSQQQLDSFHRTITRLVKSDGVVDRFEWVLISVLQKHTSSTFGTAQIKTKGSPLSSYSKEVAIVVGTLAYCGATERDDALRAFQKSTRSMGVQASLPPIEGCTMKRVNDSLKKLRLLRFTQKQTFIESCELCVSHDNKITVVEGETLRAIGDVLDCPIPLFQ